MDWDAIKTEILARLNIEQELELLGVQFIGRINANGWRACRNPFKKDDHPSCGVYLGPGARRGTLVAFNQKQPGKLRAAWSFWDLGIQLLPGSCGEFRFVLRFYAERAGVKLKSYDPPTEQKVQYYRKNLTQDVIQYLKTKRGLTDESIQKYEIGWSLKLERNTFPVRDENSKLVNIRYHNSKKTPKTLNTTGYGEARLWGLDRLAKVPKGSTVICTEGEFDSMLAEQETNLVSVSPTNGTQAFMREWVPHFFGHHVVFVWDCDAEGRQAVKNLIIPVFKNAVSNGDILSLKFVWLFEGDQVDKTHKDFTDYIVKAGGSGEALLKKIEEIEPYTYIVPVKTLPPPIPLNSFSEIDFDKYHNKRVTVPVYVFGENSEGYSAVSEMKVVHCDLLNKSKCHGKDEPGWIWTCEDPIEIPIGSRIQLSCVGASDLQLLSYLRNYVCDCQRRPGIWINPDKRLALREVYAHQVLDPNDLTESNQLIEKPIYIIGGAIVPIGRYQATGFVQAHPKNQKPTLIVDTLEPQQESWQAFDLDRDKDLLQELQEADLMDVIRDLPCITRIYERDDLHLGVLLTLCSPRWFHMPSEGRLRGRVNSIIIGDTGTGKTSVSEGIFNYVGVGYRVSGMTSSRTGITYACEYDEKGWKIKAGAMLKMSRQALIVDEAQDLPEADLKTMAEALDTGYLRIARIESRTFESETRCLFSCNPKMPERQSNQRTMDSFWYGCTAIKDIFAVMFIRRIDLVLFSTSYDIKDIAKLYHMRRKEPKYLTPEKLRALVYYAWNLREDQVQISEEVNQLILEQAQVLAEKFGMADDLPIVYPQDFRKTFARLCVSLALIDLSSDDEFQTIVVKEEHVEFMAGFLGDIYSAENCRLDAYSQNYGAEHKLNEPEAVFRIISEYMGTSKERHNRVCDIVKELLKLDPAREEKIHQKYLADLLDVDRRTIIRDVEVLVNANLVKSARGYQPTTKFVRFMIWANENHPDFFEPKKPGLEY